MQFIYDFVMTQLNFFLLQMIYYKKMYKNKLKLCAKSERKKVELRPVR